MSKFKVGDRVRLTERNTYDRWGAKGEEGTVLVEDGGASDCRVNFDRAGKWYAHWDILEMVADTVSPTITIQADKFYKTRDGRRVKVTKHDDSDTTYPFCHDSGDGMEHWLTVDGKSCIGLSDSYIIAEWLDEPVAVAPATIKVGDWVRTDNGEIGIVLHDDGSEFLQFKVGFFGEGDHGYWDWRSDLKLTVVPPGTTKAANDNAPILAEIGELEQRLSDLRAQLAA